LVRIPKLPNDYIIQDENGHIYRLDLDKKTTEEILNYHAGSIVSTDTSPLLHSVASLGEDGTVRLFEYSSKRCIGNFKYPGSGSFLCYLPEVFLIL
jgi:WD40 repeat protein